MTVTDHPAVAAYLARFDALSQHLQPARRAELRGDLLEHLAEAIPAGADDATVRDAVDRLGPPEDVLGAEHGPEGVPPASPPSSPSLLHESLAVVFLTVGSIIPVIGWLVGAVLLWTSKRWTPGEKIAGTVLVPGGPAAVAIVGAGLAVSYGPAEVCVSSSAEATPGAGDQVTEGPMQCTGGGAQPGGIVVTVLFVAALVLSFLVPFVVYRRAARRARTA